MPKTVLIIPCYNEAGRFDARGFAALGDLPGTTLLFVDDGSTDDTIGVLRAYCESDPARASLLSLPRNRGKGEAVREGMQHALAAGAEVVGYVDADLATPPGEIARMIERLEAEGLAVVMGSRIRFLGTEIERSAFRHYVGRAFATFASRILRVAVYDTQCGAKLFRRTAALEAALSEPFRTRWCFDVELLGRLLIGAPGVPPLAPGSLRELPLARWRHREGSKIGVRHAAAVLREMILVARDLSVRRRRAAG